MGDREAVGFLDWLQALGSRITHMICEVFQSWKIWDRTSLSAVLSHLPCCAKFPLTVCALCLSTALQTLYLIQANVPWGPPHPACPPRCLAFLEPPNVLVFSVCLFLVLSSFELHGCCARFPHWMMPFVVLCFWNLSYKFSIDFNMSTFHCYKKEDPFRLCVWNLGLYTSWESVMIPLTFVQFWRKTMNVQTEMQIFQKKCKILSTSYQAKWFKF